MYNKTFSVSCRFRSHFYIAAFELIALFWFDFSLNKIEQFLSSFSSSPLRKFEQFPAQKMHQNLRWPEQILARSPRWTSAISALGRASLALSVGEMDELFMVAEQNKRSKKFKKIGAHFLIRFFSLPHSALPYLRFCPCLPPPADWLLRCMR